MTRETEEDEFQRGLAELMEQFDRIVADGAIEPYSGAGVDRPLEHTTRIHLLDSLAELLGWRLELGGNMVEEARLKNGTTTFMDYLGVASQTNAPVLLIEAKAWDKPFITPQPKGANGSYESAKLIAQAIDHWRGGGSRTNSPATAEWHDYLEQVGNYVKGLNGHGHSLPRAVVTSGQWLVVFTDPANAFVDGPANSADIKIFEKNDYCKRAQELHRLISKTSLCVETPYCIRATQVQNYIKPDAVVACFHALHLSHETSGSPVIGIRPRIHVYPALVLQRNDGALVTVVGIKPLELAYRRDIEDLECALEPHLVEVSAAAEALLQHTGDLLGLELRPSSIDDFPGYKIDTKSGRAARKSLIKRHPTLLGVWVLVTGEATHFLKPAPNVSCRYHRWSACHAINGAIGKAAVSMPQFTKPKSFFTDDQPHHCAHQGLTDRRDTRCQLLGIDERLCCRTCLYAPVCWPGAQVPPLPCGN